MTTIFNLADELEAEVHRIVKTATAKAALALKQQLPASRTKTRESVYSKIQGTRGEIGFDFARKYRIAGTKTEELLTRQWANIRPLTRQYVIDRLNTFLQD
jgi:hypothetical protein